MNNMIPPNFLKVVKDFITDLIGTFPELQDNPVLSSIYKEEDADYQSLFDTIISVFPEHVMNIINENEVMFEKPCILFPGVDFKNLWNENITEKTKNIIWKYLKLILFIVLGNLNMDENFKKLIQGMDLNKSVEEIKKAFESNEDMKNLDGFMDGKLGSLAKEIAQETIGDVGDAEMFQDMMKDPSKLFSLMSSVGDKLDKKIKAGDIKESELISEASDLFSKMKDMPGMKQFEGMFKNMNMGATQAKMDENLKRAKMKERLREKLFERQKEKEKEKEKETEVNTKKKKKKKNKKNIHDVLDS